MAPFHQGEQHQRQATAFFGENIFIALASPRFPIGDFAKQAHFGHGFQPDGERLAGDMGMRLHRFKARHAVKRLAEDQQHPAVAQYFGSFRQAAQLRIEVGQ